MLLTSFFATTTLFIGLLSLDAALAPYPRLFAVYAENTVLALALVFLLQFAYHFPQRFPQRKWESRAALIVSLAYLLSEAAFMIHRYASLLGQGTVLYRYFAFDYANAVVMLWVPIAFLRQITAAERTSELATQNAELDAFAHTVAHDLKNPIGVIIGYAEILIRCETLSPLEVTESIHNIR